MKMLSTICAVAGVILAAAGMLGRFYGPPTVLGFAATSLLITSNTFLLLSIVLNTMSK